MFKYIEKSYIGSSQVVSDSERKAEQIQRFNWAKSTSDSTFTSKLDFRSDPTSTINGASDDEVRFGIRSAITTVSGNNNILSPLIAHDNEQNLNPNQVKVNPTSVFNKKNAVLKPFDGNLEGDYSCNHCNKDVSRKRVNCKRCFDFNLCIECFSSGVEIRSHKRNHPCRLIEVIIKKEVKSSMLSLKPSRKLMKKHKGKKFGKSCNLFEEIIEYDYKTKDTLYIHRSKRTPAINLEVKLDEYVGDFMLSNSLQSKQLRENYNEPNLVMSTNSMNDFCQKENLVGAYSMFVEMVKSGPRSELINFSTLKFEFGEKHMLLHNNTLSQSSIHLLPNEKKQIIDANLLEGNMNSGNLIMNNTNEGIMYSKHVGNKEHGLGCVDKMLLKMKIKLEARILFMLPWPPPHHQSLFTSCNFFFKLHLICERSSFVHKKFDESHKINLTEGSKRINDTINIFIFDAGSDTFDIEKTLAMKMSCTSAFSSVSFLSPQQHDLWKGNTSLFNHKETRKTTVMRISFMNIRATIQFEIDFKDPDWKKQYLNNFNKRFSLPHLSDIIHVKLRPTTSSLLSRGPLVIGNGAPEIPSGYVYDDDRALLKVIKFALEMSAGAEGVGPECSWVEQWVHRIRPRKHSYCELAEVKAAIVTCGGLCPGLNDVIRQIVFTFDEHGVKNIVGIPLDHHGFFDDELEITLSCKVSQKINLHGGNLLDVSHDGGKTSDIVDIIQARGIDILFVLGGNGTHAGVNAMHEEFQGRKLKVSVEACVPKTV